MRSLFRHFMGLLPTTIILTTAVWAYIRIYSLNIFMISATIKAHT